MCSFLLDCNDINRATAFREAPVFWTFSTAMYTLFQVLCLDGWADIVDSVESAYELLGIAPGFPVRVFFIAYIIVIVFILMPGTCSLVRN